MTKMTTGTQIQSRQKAKRPRWAWLLWVQLPIIALVTLAAYLGRLNLAVLALTGVDKLLHFVLCGALAFFSIAWWADCTPSRILGSLSILALLEEGAQALSIARSFSLVDLAANLLGILLFGWAAAHLVHKRC